MPSSEGSQHAYGVSQARSQGNDTEAINDPRSGGGGGGTRYLTGIIIGAAAFGGFVLIAIVLCFFLRRRRRRSKSSGERGAAFGGAGEIDISTASSSSSHDKFGNKGSVEVNDSDSCSSDNSSIHSEKSVESTNKSEIVWSFSNIERQGSLQPTEKKTDDICM